MEIFCCNYNSKSVSNILYDEISKMKIYKDKEINLLQLEKIFENINTTYNKDDEYYNKLTMISEKAKKNFEKSQKNFIKEKYILLCQQFLIVNIDNNQFNSYFIEKLFDFSDGKIKKIIFYYYTLLNQIDKSNYIFDLILDYLNPDLSNESISVNNDNNNYNRDSENYNSNSINFYNFKYILIDYIYIILSSALNSLANKYMNNNDLFSEINFVIDNMIKKEKINLFVDDILIEYQDEIEMLEENVNVANNKKKKFRFEF